MVSQAQIRTKLQDSLFAKYGKTVTLKSKSAPIYNDRVEELSQTFTSSSIVIVPYNITHKNQNQLEIGDLEEGTMEAAIPYTVTVDIGDRLTIESEDWEIKNIEQNYLPDNVVTIVQMVRVQA